MSKKRLFFCFLLLFIVAFGFKVKSLLLQRQQTDWYQQIAQEHVIGSPEEEESQADQLESGTQPLYNPVDFDALQAINPDIYAWIEIPGTVINYPVVQHQNDDVYYLNHTVEGVLGYPGSIYIESLNNKDFTDPNTVIYGHNMKDGMMFAQLHYYKDAEFMLNNPDVYIYTPDNIFIYRIFAGITYNDRHILKSFDFAQEDQYQIFLDSLAQVRNLSSYIDQQIKVTTADRILSLSTCTNQDDQRFLLMAILVTEQ